MGAKLHVLKKNLLSTELLNASVTLMYFALDFQ